MKCFKCTVTYTEIKLNKRQDIYINIMVANVTSYVVV